MSEIQKMMKIVNNDEENLRIFWTTRGISMKFSGKMYHENIKSHEKKCFTPSLVNTVLKKTFLGLRDAFFKEFLWIAPYKYVCFKFCKEVLLLFWQYKLNGCLFWSNPRSFFIWNHIVLSRKGFVQVILQTCRQYVIMSSSVAFFY